MGLYKQKTEKYRSSEKQHRVTTKKFHKNEKVKYRFKDRKA